MDRIEMYNTIKNNGWADNFKEKFNKNFTQGKNTELEEFIKFKSEHKVEEKIEKEIKSEEVKEEVKEEIPKEKTVVLEDVNISSEDVKKGIYVNKVAFIELISILQSESCIKGKDAEKILKLI